MQRLMRYHKSHSCQRLLWLGVALAFVFFNLCSPTNAVTRDHAWTPTHVSGGHGDLTRNTYLGMSESGVDLHPPLWSSWLGTSLTLVQCQRRSTSTGRRPEPVEWNEIRPLLRMPSRSGEDPELPS